MKYKTSEDGTTLIEVNKRSTILKNIPETIKNISDRVFYNSEISVVDMPYITYIGYYSFHNSSIVKVNMSNLKVVISHAFVNCKRLQIINIPNVTEIGSYAFKNCDSLLNINLSNVNIIREAAFFRCQKLKHLDIPLVTHIYYSTFENCYNLTTLNIPKVSNIEFKAFENCDNLVNIKSSLTPKQLKIAFGSDESYNNYIQRNREYKLNLTKYAI